MPNQAFVGNGAEGLKSWEILDKIIDGAADRGVVVLLDMHMIDNDLDWSPLWYEGDYTEVQPNR